MMKQTTDTGFERYGTFYNEPSDIPKTNFSHREMISTSKKLDQLFVFSSEIHIECHPGLALILVTDSPDLDNLKTFPLRRHVTLKAGVHFNLIPLTTPLSWSLFTSCAEAETVLLSPPYTYQPVSIPFHVRKIFDCWFVSTEHGEHLRKTSHRAYELLYVYEGGLDIRLSSGIHSLQPHDLIMYRSETADIDVRPGSSYLTAVFDVNQKKSLHILNHTFHCTSELQQILWKLLIESNESTYYTRTLMVCYLQEALLLLMQFYETTSHKTLLSENAPGRNDLLSEILAYMNKRITEPITIEEICHEFYISRSSLQALFKTHLNTSPKNYLLNIKLQKSKELIRQDQYTISEIAYMLGFSSIHYFSRLFKKYFNTTPSAYSRKIAENQNKSSSEALI